MAVAEGGPGERARATRTASSRRDDVYDIDDDGVVVLLGPTSPRPSGPGSRRRRAAARSRRSGVEDRVRPRRARVIVGASVGGVRTAQALRGEGYAGEMSLVGAEVAPALRQAAAVQGAARRRRGRRHGRAAHRARRPRDARDRAACWAARPPGSTRRAPGELADGELLSLRRPGDRDRRARPRRRRGARRRRARAAHPRRRQRAARRPDERGGPLVVIGAGFIGAEVAATAHWHGHRDVTVVDPAPVPMARVLDREIAQLLRPAAPTARRRHAVRRRRRCIGPAEDGAADRLRVGSPTARRCRQRRSSWGSARCRTTTGSSPRGCRWTTASSATVQPCGRRAGRARRRRRRPLVPPRLRRAVRVEHWTNAVEQAAAWPTTSSIPTTRVRTRPSSTCGATSTTGRSSWSGAPVATWTTSWWTSADPERSFAALYADPTGGSPVP